MTRVDRNVENFEEFVAGLGLSCKRRGWASIYVTVEFPDDSEATVRFADHPAPGGGGYDMENGYRHGEADFSVNPAGIRRRTNRRGEIEWEEVSATRPADARAFVLRRLTEVGEPQADEGFVPLQHTDDCTCYACHCYRAATQGRFGTH